MASIVVAGDTSGTVTLAAPAVSGTTTLTLPTTTGTVLASNSATTLNSGASAMSLQTNATTAVTVDASQNVGIGTTSPSSKLHIQGGSTSCIVKAQVTTSVGNVARYELISPVADYAWYVADDANAIVLYDYNASAERMRIDSSGRITTPANPAFFSNIAGGTYTSGQTFNGSLNGTQPSARTSGYSNGTFTAPVTGYYSFNFIIYDLNGGSGASYAVYKNGSGYIPSDWFQMINTGAMTTWSYTLYLAANDYVRMGTRSSSSNLNVYGGHSFWAGFLVG